MGKLTRYTRRETATVTAVQLDLETDGFSYRKWGGVQRARAGDWLVNNGGEVYTIDKDVFVATYAEVSAGVYRKTGHVWAREAVQDGRVKSTSGLTEYRAGDMIVFNDKDEADGWAMSQDAFDRLYHKDE